VAAGAKAMSDDENEKMKSVIEKFNAAVDVGDPVMTWPALEITKVEVLESAVRIRFVFAKTPDGRGTVAEIVLSLEAAGILKSALAAHESIPDTLPLKRDRRTTN
jgi:hypothetical protein